MFVQFDAGCVDVETDRVGLAAEGEKQAVGAKDFLAAEGHLGTGSNFFDLKIAAVIDIVDIAAGEIVLQFGNYLMVKKFQ